MRTFTCVMLCLVAAACARPLPPPGGPEDRVSPRLIEATPGALEVIPPGDRPVVFRFDERLSERNFSEALIVVSPLDSAVRVERSGDEIRVRIDGGWRPGRVYRITVLPGVRDLFGNERREPAEVVFSTGPPVPNTAVAGIVLDRVSGRSVQNAVLQAVRRADSTTYVAVGDTGGFFALRHLPLGTYDVTSWSDQNRNRRIDRLEARDQAVLTLGSESDTVATMFRVLVPDSTPAVPSTIAVTDSVRLRVTLDDYLPEEPDLSGVSAEIRTLPDSAVFARSTRVMTVAAADEERRAATPTPAPDSAAADSAGQARPPAARPPARPTVATGPLPVRDIVILLDRPLPPGRYMLEVRGLTNVNGVTGGGALPFEVRAPARPAAPPPDDGRRDF